MKRCGKIESEFNEIWKGIEISFGISHGYSNSKLACLIDTCKLKVFRGVFENKLYLTEFQTNDKTV